MVYTRSLNTYRVEEVSQDGVYVPQGGVDVCYMPYGVYMYGIRDV